MDKRHEEMLRLRQQIVEAAGALFARFGYEATTFSRIASAIGKPKSAIGYHLFPSKVALAEAVLMDDELRWRRIDDALGQDGIPIGVERLIAVLLATTRDIEHHPERAGAIRLLADLPALGLETHVPAGGADGDHARERVLFARACIAAELSPLRPSQERNLADFADLLLDATWGLVICHLVTHGREPIEARLCTLWTSLLQVAGVPFAAVVVQRVQTSARLTEIVARVDAEIAEAEEAALVL